MSLFSFDQQPDFTSPEADVMQHGQTIQVRKRGGGMIPVNPLMITRAAEKHCYGLGAVDAEATHPRGDRRVVDERTEARVIAEPEDSNDAAERFEGACAQDGAPQREAGVDRRRAMAQGRGVA